MTLSTLLPRIRACEVCSAELPLGPRPLLQVDARARVLVAGQAPGARAHHSGVPFDDASGDRLRAWMGIDKAHFYDRRNVALVPMGLCYPGSGKSGDLPPRPECAPRWRAQVLQGMPRVEVILVMGTHAMRYHLPDNSHRNLTDTVKAWRSFAPTVWPLPHPSPRNNRWLARNPWFEQELLPQLRRTLSNVWEAGSDPRDSTQLVD